MEQGKYLFKFIIDDNEERFIVIDANEDTYDTVEYEINNYKEDHVDDDYTLEDLLDEICEVDWHWYELEVNIFWLYV